MSFAFPVVTMARTEDEKETSLNEDVSRLSVDSSESASSKQDKMKDAKENKDSKFLKIKTSKKSDKNDPFRFEGEGLVFKAKLIGVDDVHSARGDKMCQDSMQMLKAVVKASGEHKQRINLSISFQGVKIKDEKTGEIIYHHPVHLISFIAQDVNDNRAFGYIYGSPQGGHKFIAIKTDKAASQAVIALRDLFEVVLAMKNAKKCNRDLGPLKDDEQDDKQSVSVDSSEKDSSDLSQKAENQIDQAQAQDENIYSDIGPEGNNQVITSSPTPPLPPGIPKNSALIDLLDLDFEFDTTPQPPKPVAPSLGLSNGSITSPDPFVVPFAFPAFQSEEHPQSSAAVSSQVLPPAGSTTAWETFTCSSPVSPSPVASTKQESVAAMPVSLETTPSQTAATISTTTTTTEDNRYACFSEIDKIPSVFENPLFIQSQPEIPSNGQNVDSTQPAHTPPLPSPPPKPPRSFNVDIFSELDPLGKDRPMTDKTLFFSELKSPPKKPLKDMGGDFGNDMFGQPSASSSTNVSSFFDTNSSKFDINNINNHGSQTFPAENDPWSAFTGTEAPLSVPSPSASPAKTDGTAICHTSLSNHKLPPLLLVNPFNPFQSDLASEPLPPPKTPPPPPPRPLASAPNASLLPVLPMRPLASHLPAAPTPPPPRRRPQPSPSLFNKNGENGLYEQEGAQTGIKSPPIAIPPRLNGTKPPISAKSSNTASSVGSESPISFGNGSNNTSPRRENTSTMVGQLNFNFPLFEKNGHGSGLSSGYDSAPASASSRSSDSPNLYSPLPTPPSNHSQSRISNGHLEKPSLPPPPPLPPHTLKPPYQQVPNHLSSVTNVSAVLSSSVSADKSNTSVDMNTPNWRSDPFSVSYNFKKLNGITPLYPESGSPDVLSPEERSIFRKNSDPFDDDFFNENFKSTPTNNERGSQNGQLCGEKEVTS